MTRVTLAKARWRNRSREGGGVIFIVAMTLSVLAALGAYSLKAASMEIKTAGYERQAAQTHYLSEYGMVGAMETLSPAYAQTVVDRLREYMANPNTTNKDTGCSSVNSGFVPSATALGTFCRKLLIADMTQTFSALGTNPVLATWTSGSGTPGSLGIIPVTGVFWVELTEPVFANAPNNAFGSNQRLVQFTVSAYGITQPSGTGTNTVAMYASEGIETARARMTGGPVTWSN